MYSTNCYPPVKFIDKKEPHFQHQPPVSPNLQYVKYVPVGYVKSHSVVVGYLLWLIGFTGAHRFYYGRPLTGMLWFLTFGLLGIGWIVDAFLIPSMNNEASSRYVPGNVDFSVAWVLFAIFGILGIHRFYQMKIVTGVLFFLTGGFFLIGMVYDAFTLNEQVSDINARRAHVW